MHTRNSITGIFLTFGFVLLRYAAYSGKRPELQGLQ